ncbi:MAG: hypothetical protein NC913_07045 [Candidatus Omnitrophica bacterium]|nr:hypothetical protein [Candidatus Omnitrophota bacterium]
MNSRERILSAIDLKDVDRIPLYCWCFGFSPEKSLLWEREGNEVKFWYTMRLEHLHKLPYEWTIYDELERVKRWLSMGIDDVIDVSIPWSISSEVIINDYNEENLMVREYKTPEGVLVQKVKKTEEEIPDGWPVQTQTCVLIDDLNLPRSEKFPVFEAGDLEKVKYLLQPPTKQQLEEYREKIKLIKDFKSKIPVCVQAHTLFGMDGVIYLMGIENAVLKAMTDEEFFKEVVDLIFNFDLMRTEIAIEEGEVDIIVQRGWYSSTDFWSPSLFRKFVLPNLKKSVDLVHQEGKKFAYVMTTGIMNFIDDFIEAGIDLLYYFDPVLDKININELKEKVKNKFCIAGGINSTLTLKNGDEKEIEKQIRDVIEIYGKKGVILSPVDSLFPDTPYKNVKKMIEIYKKYC